MVEQGPQGPSGPQGIMGAGERGERGQAGERGPVGKAGSRTKLPRRVFVAFIALALMNAAALAWEWNNSVKTINSLRVGCEAVNVLRLNQARALADQIAQTERSLGGNLGPLERFRKEIAQGAEFRRTALANLRETTAEFPVTGAAARRLSGFERAYRIDCKRAYP